MLRNVYLFVLGEGAPGGIGPLGKVTHWFYRIEYQGVVLVHCLLMNCVCLVFFFVFSARGAPHIHSLIWVSIQVM